MLIKSGDIFGVLEAGGKNGCAGAPRMLTLKVGRFGHIQTLAFTWVIDYPAPS